jgi:hypothetical protein
MVVSSSTVRRGSASERMRSSQYLVNHWLVLVLARVKSPMDGKPRIMELQREDGGCVSS